MARLVLAVDGGGSKLAAQLRDGAGRLLAQARAGPANLATDPAAALRALDDAWAQCGAGHDRAAVTLSAALAGVSSAAGRRQFRAASGFARCLLASDAYAALLGTFADGAGGLVAVGTGSVACRRDAAGFRRIGGWGFPAGDAGGGAAIGLAAVRAWLERRDALRPPDPADDALVHALDARLGVSREAVVAWLRAAEPAAFAALAPLVLAATGSPLAEGVIEAAVADLAALARAVGPGPVALTGGLAPDLAPRLRRHLDIVLGPADAVLQGACRIGFGQAAPEFEPPVGEG